MGLLPYHTYPAGECGCDEAGRGSLAGPVFAAAVMLPEGYSNESLQDSKMLSSLKRDKLRSIIEQDAISFSVQSVSADQIDEINILQASVRAMQQGVLALNRTPTCVLIDGNYFRPLPGIPHICIIKGDATYLSIAAASILAKTYRDEFMLAIDAEYPNYGWKYNKGYPTRQHIEAIMRHGLSPWHRKSYNVRSLQGRMEL